MDDLRVPRNRKQSETNDLLWRHGSPRPAVDYGMRVAALYDVEGNIPAIEAVLAELEILQPDAIV